MNNIITLLWFQVEFEKKKLKIWYQYGRYGKVLVIDER